MRMKLSWNMTFSYFRPSFSLHTKCLSLFLCSSDNIWMEAFNGKKQNIVRSIRNLSQVTKHLTSTLLLPGPCPHQSVPVEMDESMTSSSLDQAWPPPCRQCTGHTEISKCSDGQMSKAPLVVHQWKPSESQCYREPKEDYHAATCHSLPAGIWPHDVKDQMKLCEQDVRFSHSTPSTHYPQECTIEESLEPPLPLMSDDPAQYPAARLTGQCLQWHHNTSQKD